MTAGISRRRPRCYRRNAPDKGLNLTVRGGSDICAAAVAAVRAALTAPAAARG